MIIINDVKGNKVAKIRGTVREYPGYFSISDDLGNESLYPDDYHWKDEAEENLTDESLFCLSFLFSALIFLGLIIFLIIMYKVLAFL